MLRCAIFLALAASSWAAPLVSASYDEALAERLVSYAGAAYCAGSPSVTDWDCYACKRVPGFQNITSVHDPKTDGRGIVGYDPELKARIIVFMGTNANIKTWIDDILACKEAPYKAEGCKNCSVHSGFQNTWSGVKAQVYSALDTLPAGPLYVTGHSLGGALATLCAIDLVVEKQIVPDVVVTMGQPRVGGKNFAAFYGQNVKDHWRATHHRDPIPHLPYEVTAGSQKTYT
eukprot:TRINITY_DN423_c0_g1_i2.p1 TRINITY_DN423_c0_g1~~TRINITY_DN423_c0_g1_i2.p1  ORF type:complete len:231 (-),score=38.85 TRINITY_DN423_c0_g1_i2:25-717(-)